MRENYENLPTGATLEEVVLWIQKASRARNFDRQDFDLQQSSRPKIYVAPSSSSDLVGTEKAGDIAVDTNYLYVVVDNSGTLQWQRVATSTF